MTALNEAYRELDGTESERVIGVSKLKPSAPPGPATDYLTISQAAQRLGMDKRNVRYYIKKGGLEVVQFGPHSKLIHRTHSKNSRDNTLRRKKLIDGIAYAQYVCEPHSEFFPQLGYCVPRIFPQLR